MSILAGYLFYKNTVMVLVQCFYMFTTGVSAQKFYCELDFQLYDLCYTSILIIVLGVLDCDVPWDTGKHSPELYRVDPRMELFNDTFFKWICSAVYESAAIFLLVIFGFNDAYSDAGSVQMVQYGLLTFMLVALVCNMKICLLQMLWTLYGSRLW